jgi:HicB family
MAPAVAFDKLFGQPPEEEAAPKAETKQVATDPTDRIPKKAKPKKPNLNWVAILELTDEEIDDANRIEMEKEYHGAKVRLPKKLHEHIRNEAHRRRCSVNALITAALIRHFGDFDKEV